MLLVNETISKYQYSPSDLKPASHKKVVVRCDFCNTVSEKSYGRYNEGQKKNKVDACKKCKTKKMHSNLSNENKTKIKEKREQTNLLKYGTACPANNAKIQKRIQENNIQNYGVRHSIERQEVQEKIKTTVMSKYGVSNVFSPDDIRQKSTNTMIEKYGKPHAVKFGKLEKSMVETLNAELGAEFKSNHVLIAPKHLDAYDNESQIAIELCGLYWHHEDSPTPRKRKYHHEKYKQCLAKGVQLLTIWEDEWLTRQPAIISHIRSLLGKNKRVFARSCQFVLLDKYEADTFMEQHHIQGKTKHSKYHYGLKCDGELLGCITYSLHHRKIVPNEIVLSRMAFKSGITIVGGASKMFNNSKQQLQKIGFTKIISWSDNRYSLGNVYSTLGFLLEKEYGPDYCYVYRKLPKKRIPKQSCRKSILKANKTQTERERAVELGLSRLWDCGKKKWVYQLNLTS